MFLVADGNGAVGPGNQVVLVGRETDQVDERVCESALASPAGASPQLDTKSMDTDEVCTERRPLNKSLSPELPVDDVLGRILVVIPEHANGIASMHHKLVAPAA